MLNNKSILKLILILAITASLGNIFDAATTYFALQKGHIESNPFMKYIIDNFGFTISFIIKLAFIYIILPIKYFPMYYYFESIMKIKNIKIKIFTITLMITVYLILNYYFWNVSFGNLRFIVS
ncbi:MAG: hypothetical protein IH934_01640 [Nanoarchaeota archaeon]|nr:hypothetical protein [Nanoarchaeota archaeon]